MPNGLSLSELKGYEVVSLARTDDVKDNSKRFAEIAGWGYAQRDYDAAADGHRPNAASVVNCGTQCIFHPYQKR